MCRSSGCSSERIWPPGGRGSTRDRRRPDAGAAGPRRGAFAATDGAAPKVEADTSYCCVVDRWGNAFSATPSDGSGNVPVAPGLGIIAVRARSQSRPDPRHTLRRRAGQAAAADAQSGDAGDRGRRRDAVRHARRRCADPGDAAGVAQHHAFRHGPAGGDRGAAGCLLFLPVVSFAPFEYFPGRLAVEGAIPQATREALAASGHELQEWPDWTWLADRSRRSLRIRRLG